jgi:ABC-type hemin transport system ATPase subunit
MISATQLELRAGARILLSPSSLRVQPGDRIGLVGRNGAGKTTMLKVLAGEGQPFGDKGGKLVIHLYGKDQGAAPAFLRRRRRLFSLLTLLFPPEDLRQCHFQGRGEFFRIFPLLGEIFSNLKAHG